MSEPEKIVAEIQALREFQQTDGWEIFRNAVVQEIAGDFEETITKVLNSTDSAVALDKMRQVAAIRKAGFRWLKWPQERIEQLTAQAQREEEAAMTPSRRPIGL